MQKMTDNRAYQAGLGMNSSPDGVRRAGGDLGEDPRRFAAKIVMDSKIKDHDQSGYNHAYTPEQDRFARDAERKAVGMGQTLPDGTRGK